MYTYFFLTGREILKTQRGALYLIGVLGLEVIMAESLPASQGIVVVNKLSGECSYTARGFILRH